MTTILHTQGSGIKPETVHCVGDVVSGTVFDDPNLVSCAGLVSVLDLAERAGLRNPVGAHLRVTKAGGANEVL
jgi:hypothetical protein